LASPSSRKLAPASCYFGHRLQIGASIEASELLFWHRLQIGASIFALADLPLKKYPHLKFNFFFIQRNIHF
jgi:hypothetical protein